MLQSKVCEPKTLPVDLTQGLETGTRDMETWQIWLIGQPRYVELESRSRKTCRLGLGLDLTLAGSCGDREAVDFVWSSTRE